MNTIRTKFCAAAYCTLGLTSVCLHELTTSAQAWGEDLATKTVKYDDLNLASTAGAKALYGRIRAAAREVCNRSAGSDPILRVGGRACMEKAIDNAVKKVDAPELTALRFGSSVVRLASK